MAGPNRPGGTFDGRQSAPDRRGEISPDPHDTPRRRADRLPRRLLSDANPGNRWKAAQALGRTQDPAAVDALLRALYDDDWRVQRKAIWALGSIGDPRAIPPLRRRYTEVDEGLRDLIRDAQELIQARMYRPE